MFRPTHMAMDGPMSGFPSAGPWMGRPRSPDRGHFRKKCNIMAIILRKIDIKWEKNKTSKPHLIIVQEAGFPPGDQYTSGKPQHPDKT